MIYDKVIAAMGLPFALVYAALLLGLLYFVFISIPRTLRTKFWPTAIGRVTSSNLRQSKRLTKNGGSITVYEADIEYHYKVDGKEYASKKIKWVDHRGNSKSYHQKVLETYAEGREVEVYYNPKAPATGILEPGFGTGNFIALLFFLLSLGSMTVLLSTKL